ncbi:MAG: 7-cyano-7-deazaguanine synthase [Deltaproteobacteria bacterium]|nr:7-cyano-7-deazaguanine synthase [Deltaproteobacteria bacterium]
MTRVCRTCLFYEGMRFFLHPHLSRSPAAPVRIGDDGRCSFCALYEERFSPAFLGAERQRFEEDARPVLVLFSGGKDSAAALARTLKMGKRAHALLFDNGFVPREVVEQAQRTCDRLGVPLFVERGGADLAGALAQLDVNGRTPCEACINAVWVHAARRARELDVSYVVQGTNYWATWSLFPVGTRLLVEDRMVIHLPFVTHQSAEETRALLREVGFEPAELAGVSSNCRVPERVQERVAEALGHVPELEDLSLEVMVGHLSRAEAVETLRQKAPGHRALLVPLGL